MRSGLDSRLTRVLQHHMKTSDKSRFYRELDIGRHQGESSKDQVIRMRAMVDTIEVRSVFQ